jgi:hypothetical protein
MLVRAGKRWNPDVAKVVRATVAVASPRSQDRDPFIDHTVRRRSLHQLDGTLRLPALPPDCGVDFHGATIMLTPDLSIFAESKQRDVDYPLTTPVVALKLDLEHLRLSPKLTQEFGVRAREREDGLVRITHCEERGVEPVP